MQLWGYGTECEAEQELLTQIQERDDLDCKTMEDELSND